MGPAINPQSRTIYGKQNPLIKKKKKEKKMPSAHVQKEGTTQTEESSQNNCSVRYNNDGKQTKSMHRGAVEMKYHQGLVTDSAIRSTLAHPNTLVRALAPQSRREAAGDCTRRLLRAQTPRARAGGNAVLF